MTVIAADRPHSHEGLHDPLPAPLERLLRQAAYDHAVNDARRLFTPQLHIGVPGRPHFVLPADIAADRTVRTDAIAAMLERSRADGVTRPLCWLVRPGGLDSWLTALESDWLAAARTAYAEADERLVFVLVSRRGWRDPRSGLGRTWERLRAR